MKVKLQFEGLGAELIVSPETEQEKLLLKAFSDKGTMVRTSMNGQGAVSFVNLHKDVENDGLATKWDSTNLVEVHTKLVESRELKGK